MTMHTHPIDITPSGYGHWIIRMMYRGRQRKAITTNSMAIDRYKSDEPNTRNGFYNTRAQAWRALKNDIVNTIN